MEEMDIRYCEKLKEHLNKYDVFAAGIGAEILEITPGYAKAVLPVNASHMNAAGVVQGGAIFTLADFAFAGAGNSLGSRAVAMNVSITYMRPGTGTELVAEAKEVSHGKRTCLFDVLVTDDKGKKVAKLMINGFLFEGESVV